MKKYSPLLFICSVLFSLMLISSCKNDPFPRPVGYPRIDLPPHSYKVYDNSLCPFTLEYPAFGAIGKESRDSCMVDLSFKDFNFKWHFTYRNIDGSKKTRTQHDDEYRKLVFKHISKLSHLNEIELKGENGWGVLYEMFGKVGSPAQLIYGDSTHIVMASFYFLEAVNQDSLKPLIDYVKKDLRYMTESLKWKNPE